MDELLLARARNGDPSAIEALLTPVEDRVWRVCWHYMGNRADTEDCAQEAMVRIWKHLADYREESVFEAWCSRIAANTCLDLLRKKTREKTESLTPLEEQGFDPADNAPTPEEAAVCKDEHQALRAAIRSLPEDQREALVLTQLEGLEYETVAEMLGVSAGTVKSRVFRARQKLAELLKPAEDDSPVTDTGRKPIPAPIQKRSRGRDP